MLPFLYLSITDNHAIVLQHASQMQKCRENVLRTYIHVFKDSNGWMDQGGEVETQITWSPRLNWFSSAWWPGSNTKVSLPGVGQQVPQRALELQSDHAGPISNSGTRWQQKVTADGNCTGWVASSTSISRTASGQLGLHVLQSQHKILWVGVFSSVSHEKILLMWLWRVNYCCCHPSALLKKTACSQAWFDGCGWKAILGLYLGDISSELCHGGEII